MYVSVLLYFLCARQFLYLECTRSLPSVDLLPSRVSPYSLTPSTTAPPSVPTGAVALDTNIAITWTPITAASTFLEVPVMTLHSFFVVRVMLLLP